MSDNLWTLIIVPFSILGVWLCARHWWGWVISASTEVLWMAYAFWLHSTSLKIMSLIWAALHIRNARRTWLDGLGVKDEW